MTASTLAAGPYSAPRVSPDGTRVALETSDAKERYIGSLRSDWHRGAARITFGGNSNSPVWSPDGTRIAFQSAREGDLAIFAQAADGSGAPQRLTGRPPASNTSRNRGSAACCSSTSSRLARRPCGSCRSRTARRRDSATCVRPMGPVPCFRRTVVGSLIRCSKSAAAACSSNRFQRPTPPYMLVKMDGSAPHHPMWSADGTMLTYVPWTRGQ